MTDRFIENRIENSSSSVTALPDPCHVFMDFVGVSLGYRMKKEKKKLKKKKVLILYMLYLAFGAPCM